MVEEASAGAVVSQVMSKVYREPKEVLALQVTGPLNTNFPRYKAGREEWIQEVEMHSS